MPRFVLAAFLAVMLIVVPQAASRRAVPSLPTDLHAFLLRVDEPVKGDHTYAEMPAFAWHPIVGASSYDLQLAVNRSFSDTSILYENKKLTAPVASIQLQVPWMNGDPYALWVHVRAVVHGNTTQWSEPFGFNTGWQNTPAQEPAPSGLIRWTPVEGATSYQVWFMNIGRVFPVLTNVADEREYWTLHPNDAGIIRWRVRALRYTALDSLPSGTAISRYGPWSDVFTTLTPASIKQGPLKGVATVSDVQSSGPHALMPGFAWSGTDGLGPSAIGQQLWRVYVFSDKKCVNEVMVGSVTGAPAWAPRATQALALPETVKAVADTTQKGTILPPGKEGATFMADLTPVTASENAPAAASPTPTSATPGTSTPGTSTPGSATPSSSAPSSSTPTSNGTTAATATAGAVELPDSGWPTGRYWWTVIPVDIVDIPPADGSPSGPGDAVEYHDAELPQDACATGRVWSFAMRSAPVTAASGAGPYASGLASSERVTAAAAKEPKFVELPLVAWKPAIGAQSYEIQLSRHLYPWVATKNLSSVVTSAVLPLSRLDHGTWYYRVRGVNPNLPANAQKMTWSSPVSIGIVGNRIVVLR